MKVRYDAMSYLALYRIHAQEVLRQTCHSAHPLRCYEYLAFQIQSSVILTPSFKARAMKIN